MPNMQINDVNVYYEVHGEGEPLLLIGGFNQDVLGWFFQTTAYSLALQGDCLRSQGCGEDRSPGCTMVLGNDGR